MATQAEKQQLIDTLKFTPCTYTISMWGYGGEKVMGTVSREVYDYCMANQVDLQDIAWNSDAAEEMELDEDRLPFPPGSWYECDDMAHTNGVSRTAGTLQITDENGKTVFEKSLDDIVGGGCDGEPEWSCFDEAWIGSKPAGTVVFIGTSNEKGTFFEGEIELTAPFDITKLTLQYDEVDGEELVNCVQYDGEEIDNNGGSTDGKSSDFGMYVVKDSNSWETYNPEEKDWGHPEWGTSPSEWERSETFKFNKVKPTIPGYYNAVWKNFGTTTGSLYWDGKDFGEWEYGKFKPQAGVESWSGYNWDTGSWGNQPPEPPNVVCDNKECGWIGMSADRVTDDDYNDHCPECEGIEFSWIDYDPDSKKGLDNRKKYCRPAMPADWDPVAELDKILDEFVIEESTSENPPKAICKNCGFLGTPEFVEPNKEMRTAFLCLCKCPACGVIDNNSIEWLNYDLTTKEGKKNLKKYSKENA
jgi:hypothetical protein